MAKPVPIFRGEEETFQADACLPLIAAWERRSVRLEALVHGHYPGKRLPAGALPGLKTVGFWDGTGEQHWGLPWHRNEGVELTYLESGSFSFAVDRKEHELQPGDLTVTRPWQLHRVGNPHVGASRLHWLILDVGVRRPNQEWKWPPWLLLSAEDLTELTDILRHSEQAVWRASADLQRCFHGIAQSVEADGRHSAVSSIAVRANELFLLLLELLRERKPRLDRSLSTASRTVQLFLRDLQQHPELDWTVHGMAASCGLGVTQFVRHVRLLANMTPMHYVNRCRLERAAAMLQKHPGERITEVALECGFASSQYFATVFRRQYGCAPRDYRR